MQRHHSSNRRIESKVSGLDGFMGDMGIGVTARHDNPEAQDGLSRVNYHP